MLKKSIKVLKDIGKTLSTTVLGKDFLSISQWTEIINEDNHNSDYMTI